MVSVRKKGEGDLGMMTIDDFAKIALEEVNKNIVKF